MPALLDAELDANHHRGRGEHHVDRALDVGDRYLGMGDPGLDRYRRQSLTHLIEADGVGGEEVRRLTAAPQNRREHRSEKEGIRAGAELQMQVGHLGHLRAPRVDDDHPAAGRLLDLVDGVARRLEAVRHPRIAAEHDEQIGVLDVLGGMTELRSEEVAVDPEIARLFLRQRIEVLGRTEVIAQRGEPGGAEVIALTAAAVECNRVAAVLGVQRVQPRGDLPERGLPGHRLVGAVRGAPQRRRQPVGMIAVPLQTLRLLAQVACRAPVRPVAADARDRAAVGGDLESAVHVAKDARRLAPRRIAHESLRLLVQKLDYIIHKQESSTPSD